MARKPPAVWIPSELPDAYAIQALAKGTATEEQQQRALRCIIEEIAGTYDMSYDPESDRQTAFAEGRRHVGRVLVGIVKVNLGTIKAGDERRAKRQTAQTTVIRKGKPNG